MARTPNPNLYEALGGKSACRRLAVAFYARVARDPLLRPLFPGKTFTCAIEEFRFSGAVPRWSERRFAAPLVVELAGIAPALPDRRQGKEGLAGQHGSGFRRRPCGGATTGGISPFLRTVIGPCREPGRCGRDGRDG